MPFELGLSVAHERLEETNPRMVCLREPEIPIAQVSKRSQWNRPVRPWRNHCRSLFELSNIFVRNERQPSIQQMGLIYREVRNSLPIIFRLAGSPSLYTPRVFQESLCNWLALPLPGSFDDRHDKESKSRRLGPVTRNHLRYLCPPAWRGVVFCEATTKSGYCRNMNYTKILK